MKSQRIFREVQRMNHPLVWAVSGVITGIWVWGFVQQVFLGVPFGDNPVSDTGLILLGLIPLSLWILIGLTRLEIRMDEKGLRFRYAPFINAERFYSWDQIKEIRVRKFSPLKEYWGWGLRMSLKGNGMAYTISGNQGIQLELRSGKRFLLGVGDAESARNFLKSES